MTLLVAIGLGKIVPDWKVRVHRFFKRRFCLLGAVRGAPALAGEAPEDRCELHARLHAPSRSPYKLRSYTWGSYASQDAQDVWVDHALNGSEGLFAVESGAFDGEFLSNTLFLETRRRWQCLLVEANPYLAEQLFSRRRKCHVLLAGLSISGSVGSFRFRPRQVFGGFEETLAPEDEAEWRDTWDLMRGNQIQRWAIGLVLWLLVPFALDLPVDVTAFPMHMVLRALGRNVVDYWSLDTEGSELRILEGTDFAGLEFGIISIEARNDTSKQTALVELLGRRGMELVGTAGRDLLFASRRYFHRRGLPFPTGPMAAANLTLEESA